MAWKDPRDPRDPWAWRNTWTGEARTDYAELWIVIPLIVLLVLLALLILTPLLIHMFCRHACPWPAFWRRFDKFMRVLHDIGRNPSQQDPRSFVNPAFDPELRFEEPKQAKPSAYKRFTPLRHSVHRGSSCAPCVSVTRSKSCPARPVVPRIKL